MWEPDPDWQPLRSGPSSAGVWRAERDGRAWVVKRLRRPGPDDPAALHDRTHPGWWRREAAVASAPGFVTGAGLVPAEVGGLEEDETGVVVWVAEVAGEPPTALQVARALGEFAATTPSGTAPAWAARDQLRRRLRLTEERGGWRTLARTTMADVTERLWERRDHWLETLDQLPAGRVHGDAAPGNFLGVRDDAVVAGDWQCVGVGPVGADLGYWALSCREDFEVLLEAFCAAVPTAEREAAAVAARVSATYSVLSRAEHALAQAAKGEGALAGKFRHPAVAPYLRAVQRHFDQAEALL